MRMEYYISQHDFLFVWSYFLLVVLVLPNFHDLDEKGSVQLREQFYMHEMTDISKLHSTVNYFLPKHVVFSLVITEHLEFGKLLIDIRCLEICWLN